MVSPDAAEPSIVTVPVVLMTGSGPLVPLPATMVCPARLEENTIVPPLAASAAVIAARNEPVPELLVLVTVNICACAAVAPNAFAATSAAIANHAAWPRYQ